MAAMVKSGHVLCLASKALRNDKDVVMAALEKKGIYLEYASLELQNNRSVVMAAINNSDIYSSSFESVLNYVSAELKNDKEVVMAAVEKNASSLVHASDKLKNDREVAMVALKKTGHALADVSDRLKNDKEVVMVVVKECGNALRHASDELKNDKGVAMVAVKNDGHALAYLSDELKNDKSVAMVAIANSSVSYHYSPLTFLSHKLRNDKEVVMAVVRKKGSHRYRSLILWDCKMCVLNGSPRSWSWMLDMPEHSTDNNASSLYPQLCTVCLDRTLCSRDNVIHCLMGLQKLKRFPQIYRRRNIRLLFIKYLLEYSEVDSACDQMIKLTNSSRNGVATPSSTSALGLKQGDRVKIISGKHAGKEGKIESMSPQKARVCISDGSGSTQLFFKALQIIETHNNEGKTE